MPGAFHWGKWRKKVFRTYTVVCIWKLLYLLFTLMYKEVHFSRVELVHYLFLFGSLDGVSSGVLWFMYAYILLLLFYPVSYFLFCNSSDGRKILLYLMGVCFVGGIAVNSLNFILELLCEKTGHNVLSISDILKVIPFGNWQNMMFFFLLGAFLLSYRDHISEFFNKGKLYRLIPLGMIVVGTGGLVLVKYLQTGTVRWNGVYLENGYCWVSTALLSVGIYLAIQNCTVPSRFTLLETIGKHTMGIYYMHYAMLAFLSYRYFQYFSAYKSVLLNTGKTVVIIAVCVWITMGLKKVPGLKMLVS